MEDWETYCERTSYSEKQLRLLETAKQKLRAAHDSISTALDRFCEAMDRIYDDEEFGQYYKQMEEISDMLDDLNVATDALQNEM